MKTISGSSIQFLEVARDMKMICGSSVPFLGTYEHDIWITFSISCGCCRYDIWVESRSIIPFCEVAIDTDMISGSSIQFLEVAVDMNMISRSSIQFLEVAVDT